MGFHSSAQPLTEEYTTIKNQWPLSDTDIAEVARNSVLQSGFTDDKKKELISEYYKWGGVAGNDPLKTDIPARRAAFRHEVRLEEYYWIFKKTRLHEIEQKKNEKKKLVSERTKVPLRNVTSNTDGVFTPKSKDEEEYMAQSVSVLVGKDQRWRWFSHTKTATIPGGKRWPIHWYDLVDESMKRDSKDARPMTTIIEQHQPDSLDSELESAATDSAKQNDEKRAEDTCTGTPKADGSKTEEDGNPHRSEVSRSGNLEGKSVEQLAQMLGNLDTNYHNSFVGTTRAGINAKIAELKRSQLGDKLGEIGPDNHQANLTTAAKSPPSIAVPGRRLAEETRVRALIARRRREIKEQQRNDRLRR